MPVDDNVPVYSLFIDPSYIKALNSNLPESGKKMSYPAIFHDGHSYYDIQARYRGSRYWHWLFTQKSWRLNFSDNKMFNRRTKINIVNPKTVLSFNEITSMYLAEQAGLLAVTCLPVKFIVNKQYKGFYLYLEQIDDFFIRSKKRITGNIYDGDYAAISENDGVSLLWKDSSYWAQTFSPFISDENNREDIRSFIAALNTNDHMDFYDYAISHLDIDNYCSYAAFDSIVGSFHHTYHQNNKLFFDAVTGKFVAIPWDIHMWYMKIQPEYHTYDLSANQLLHKWKLIPEFEYRRQLRIWQLINDVLSDEKILKRLEHDYNLAYNIIKSDKFRDALQPNSLMNLYYEYFRVKPFSMIKFKERYKTYQNTIIQRKNFLHEYLSNSKGEYYLDSKDNYTRLHIVASGTTGIKLKKFRINSVNDKIKVYKDINRNGTLDNKDPYLGIMNLNGNSASFAINENIFSGFNILTGSMVEPIHYGIHHHIPSPLLYTYFLVGGKLKDIKIEAQNAVTGANVAISKVDSIDLYLINQTDSLHPWDIPPKPLEEEIVIGPGELVVKKTKIYPENMTVKIIAGTTITLLPETSLIFRDKVIAIGSEDNPITISCTDKNKYWNTFALQGDKTSGSIFEHCLWEHGSRDKVDLIYYPAMISIHDTGNIIFKNCVFRNNKDNSTGVRVGYGKKILFRQCRFDYLNDNGISVDISDINILSSEFNNCIGNGINLMNSTANIEDALFNEIKSSAVFSREDSVVKINQCKFTDSNVCIEAQDASQINIENVKFYNSINAIKTSKGIYPETPKITSDEIFVSSCRKTILNETNADIDIKQVTDNQKNSIDSIFKDR